MFNRILHAVPLLVIERLERARCATARRMGKRDEKRNSSLLPILRAAVPLARSSLSLTVDEKERDCVQFSLIANSHTPSSTRICSPRLSNFKRVGESQVSFDRVLQERLSSLFDQGFKRQDLAKKLGLDANQ